MYTILVYKQRHLPTHISRDFPEIVKRYTISARVYTHMCTRTHSQFLPEYTHTCARAHTQKFCQSIYTGWRRPIGCLISQITFRKLATNYRALLRKMIYEDKASCSEECVYMTYTYPRCTDTQTHRHTVYTHL